MQKEISNELSGIMCYSDNVRVEGIVPYGHDNDFRTPVVLQVFATSCVMRADKGAADKLKPDGEWYLRYETDEEREAFIDSQDPSFLNVGHFQELLQALNENAIRN